MPAKRSTSARNSSTVHTRTDMIGRADELIQRRIQPVRVTGQPVADKRQQFAQLNRLANVKTPKGASPRFRHRHQDYRPRQPPMKVDLGPAPRHPPPPSAVRGYWAAPSRVKGATRRFAMAFGHPLTREPLRPAHRAVGTGRGKGPLPAGSHGTRLVTAAPACQTLHEDFRWGQFAPSRWGHFKLT